MENHIGSAGLGTTTKHSSSSVAVVASLFVVASALSLLFIISYSRRVQYHGRKLPPGPPGLPLIGHLHLLMSAMPPHRSLSRLSQKYGPFLFIRLGSMPAVVVSSPSVAKEFLLIHDLHFSDRPTLEAGKRIFYRNRGLSFAQYGPTWRELRRIYTLQILSSKKIEMSKRVRREEIGSALQEIEHQSQKGDFLVEMGKLLYNLAGNVMSRTLFSKRAFGSFKEVPEFREMVVEMSALFGTILIGDVIPNLHWLDPQGYKKRMDSVFKRMDAFLDQVVRERLLERQMISEKCIPKDFLDLLIDIYKGSLEDDGTDAIKCALLELLSASAETSSTTIEWVMSELLRNPRVMKQLQQELDNVVEGKTQVEESDIPKLEYLEAVVKETFRLHPPVPLLMHQMSRPANEVGDVAGYYIPEKTRVVVNLWAIGRDPLVWENAEEFRPERFMGNCSNIDVRGHHFELLPFGSGRRGCPGMNLGLLTVGLVISNLVYRFDWSLPAGESPGTLDMMENLGLTAPKAKPLLAVPKDRRLLLF